MTFLTHIIDKIRHYVEISELQDAIEFLSDNVAKYQKTMGAFGTRLKQLAKRIDDVVQRLEEIEQVLDEFAEASQELETTTAEKEE